MIRKLLRGVCVVPIVLLAMPFLYTGVAILSLAHGVESLLSGLLLMPDIRQDGEAIKGTRQFLYLKGGCVGDRAADGTEL